MTFIADEAATWAQGMANYFNDVAREPPAKKCKRNTVRFLPQRLATLDWMRAIENSLRVSRSGEGGGGSGQSAGGIAGYEGPIQGLSELGAEPPEDETPAQDCGRPAPG